MIKNLMAMLVLASMAMAPAAVAEMKIVVLDPVRAILESDEGKVLVDAANKEMESEQNELRGMAEQIQEQQTKLQKDGEILSDSDKRKI
ncbi:MAG: OmpH family outer membrane protein, partial [Candidatus Azotimanducaceae bacterium]